MRYPAQLRPLTTAAADACREASAALRHTAPLMDDDLDSVPDLVYGSGLDGLATFVNDLARWPDLFPPDQLDAALRALAAFIDKAGTGGGLFRRLQADYLAYLADHTGLSTAQRAADTYTNLAQLWSDLANTATADTDIGTRIQIGDIVRAALVLTHTEHRKTY